jgi:hypothetical protein
LKSVPEWAKAGSNASALATATSKPNRLRMVLRFNMNKNAPALARKNILTPIKTAGSSL